MVVKNILLMLKLFEITKIAGNGLISNMVSCFLIVSSR